MKRMRRFGGAIVMALTIAVVMGLGSARLEAKGKPDRGDAQAAICAYLLAVIEYPYVSPYIKLWASSLYTYYGCQPAL
jgi:hypothetical protein